MVPYIAIVLCLFTLLSGCAHQDKKQISDKNTKTESEIIKDISIREQEAKLADVPFPLNIQPLSAFNILPEEPNHSLLGYTTATDVSELVMFYQQEMERLGWQENMHVKGSETQLLFQKPDRVCSVSLRPIEASFLQSAQTHIVVAVSSV